MFTQQHFTQEYDNNFVDAMTTSFQQVEYDQTYNNYIPEYHNTLTNTNSSYNVNYAYQSYPYQVQYSNTTVETTLIEQPNLNIQVTNNNVRQLFEDQNNEYNSQNKQLFINSLRELNYKGNKTFYHKYKYIMLLHYITSGIDYKHCVKKIKKNWNKFNKEDKEIFRGVKIHKNFKVSYSDLMNKKIKKQEKILKALKHIKTSSYFEY